MNQLTTCLVALTTVSIIASTAWAQAPAPDTRIGAEVSGSLALNMCADDGDSECDTDTGTLGSSGASQISVGYRIMPNFGAYLDLNYSMLSVELTGAPDGAESSWTSLAMMPTVRAFMPLPDMDLWVGLGAGYQSTTLLLEFMGDEFETTRSNSMDAKAEVGGAFFLNDKLSVGVTLQMLFLVNGAGEVCQESSDGKSCSDTDSDSVDMMQLGAVLRYRL